MSVSAGSCSAHEELPSRDILGGRHGLQRLPRHGPGPDHRTNLAFFFGRRGFVRRPPRGHRCRHILPAPYLCSTSLQESRDTRSPPPDLVHDLTSLHRSSTNEIIATHPSTAPAPPNNVDRLRDVHSCNDPPPAGRASERILHESQPMPIQPDDAGFRRTTATTNDGRRRKAAMVEDVERRKRRSSAVVPPGTGHRGVLPGTDDGGRWFAHPRTLAG